MISFKKIDKKLDPSSNPTNLIYYSESPTMIKHRYKCVLGKNQGNKNICRRDTAACAIINVWKESTQSYMGAEAYYILKIF
ncbi:MAG: hypothetical protein IPQ02_15440 [Saprospiraceae bacterium]|nr:hypothetical protein [Candidatus Defluviibacterium haderslevense]